MKTPYNPGRFFSGNRLNLDHTAQLIKPTQRQTIQITRAGILTRKKLKVTRKVAFGIPEGKYQKGKHQRCCRRVAAQQEDTLLPANCALDQRIGSLLKSDGDCQLPHDNQAEIQGYAAAQSAYTALFHRI